VRRGDREIEKDNLKEKEKKRRRRRESERQIDSVRDTGNIPFQQCPL
jgi:hypothetical protein